MEQEDENSDVGNDEDEENLESASKDDLEPDPKTSDGDRDIDKIYGLDTYDDEENDNGLTIGGMVFNPQDDPYLRNIEDDERSDIEDFNIKPTDNLILVGHVEGNAAILEVYGMYIYLNVFPQELKAISTKSRNSFMEF